MYKKAGSLWSVMPVIYLSSRFSLSQFLTLLSSIKIFNTMITDLEQLKKNLGLKIHIERQKSKITQEELAEWADVSVATLSNVERGLVLPTLESTAKIANALQLSLPELFTFNF